MAGHGGRRGNVKAGCQCRGCRDRRQTVRDQQRAKRAAGLPDEDPRHGTYNGYVNFYCRCPRCSEADALTRARPRR
jgi:hypothetical protein